MVFGRVSSATSFPPILNDYFEKKEVICGILRERTVNSNFAVI